MDVRRVGEMGIEGGMMVEEIIGMLGDGITGIGIMVIVVGIMEEIEIGIGIVIETVIVEVIDGKKSCKENRL